MRVAEGEREAAAFPSRFSGDVEEEGGVADRVEDQGVAGRQGQRHRGLFARLKLHDVECDLFDDLLGVLGEIDGRAEEDLARVFGERKRIGFVRRDPADSRVHGEGDLDELVERRFVVLRAKGAEVFGTVESLQRRARLEHAAAARAERAEAHVEEPEARRMHERADRRLFVEAVLGGEGERVDPVQRPVGTGLHLPLEDGRHLRVGRLPKKTPERPRFSHAASSLIEFRFARIEAML